MSVMYLFPGDRISGSDDSKINPVSDPPSPNWPHQLQIPSCGPEQTMASAIFFESRSTILATIQHNWQCISWLIIDSTKEFHVDRYENISKQDECI